MELEDKPTLAVRVFRHTVNAVVVMALLALMAYLIPLGMFWAIGVLTDTHINMTPEHIAAAWTLNIAWGLMTGMVLAFFPRRK
jgi:hypothetical protein